MSDDLDFEVWQRPRVAGMSKDVSERVGANIEWSHGHLGKRYYLNQAKAELVRLQMIAQGNEGNGLLQTYPCTWTDEFTWPKIEGNKHWHVGHRSEEEKRASVESGRVEGDAVVEDAAAGSC